MREQRKYSAELKAEAIKMVREQGLMHEEVGRLLSIPRGTVSRWMYESKSFQQKAIPGDLSVAELTSENNRLRKALNEARMEQEILKKAAAYFAKETLQSMRS